MAGVPSAVDQSTPNSRSFQASELHKGHAGHRPGVETHFRLMVVSSLFVGRSRVDRQRLVTAALKEEMGNPIHALSMKVLTPEEAEAQAG